MLDTLIFYANKKAQLSVEIILIIIFMLFSGIVAVHALWSYYPYHYQKFSSNEFYAKVSDYGNIKISGYLIKSDGSFQVGLQNSRTPHTLIINNVSVVVNGKSATAVETDKFEVSLPPGKTAVFTGSGLGSLSGVVDAYYIIYYTDPLANEVFYKKVMLRTAVI